MACAEAGTLTGMSSPCGCCGPNFGCGWAAGVYKPHPLTLSYLLSLAGSCPEGTQSVTTGTLTFVEPETNQCEDPELVEDCDALPGSFCTGCVYRYVIAPGSVPACGQ